MTDVTIPDLPPAGPITGSEVFPGIQSGADVQFSMAALLALARARATHTGEQAISSVTGLTAALAAKAIDAVVVKLTGNQTVAGVKTFSDSPVVPDASFSIAKTSGLQTALDAKALDSAVAHDTGNETWAGVKTFSSSPLVPDLSWSIAKTTGLQAALDAKALDADVVHDTGNETVAGIKTFSDDLAIGTAGKGHKVKEGSNAKQGTATLVAGTVTVSNTSVTANSRIFLTVQSLGTVAAPVAVAVTARTAGASFVITSADATDTSVVAYEIFEPA